jgi:hypothetical protein
MRSSAREQYRAIRCTFQEEFSTPKGPHLFFAA